MPGEQSVQKSSLLRTHVDVLCQAFILVMACLFVFDPVFAQTPNAKRPGEGTGGRLTNPVRDPSPVPPAALDGAADWLNTSQPLSLRDLRGKVVLLDFWTYCCINCIHILPDLKYLEEKYEKQLIVIGIHSAKFANERESDNIREAIQRYEIRHPVVNDSDMALWTRFGVSSWPTLILIDPEGNFAGALAGEGHRDRLDKAIGQLVEYHRSNGTLDETPLLFELESQRAERTPLRYPGKILADAASQRLFISDSNHNRIVIADADGRLIDVVGSGRIGLKDGSFEDAEFDHPQGCALAGDQLYVADTENHAIRRIDLKSRTVSTLAGTGQQAPFNRTPGGTLQSTLLNSPWALTHVDGTLYIAMAGPHQIWSHRLGTDRIARYAGSGIEDVINGTLLKSAFAQPSGLVPDSEGRFLYVVDSEGSSIRRVPIGGRGNVTTVAGTSDLPQGASLFAFGDQDGIGSQARFQHPLGITFCQGLLYVADSYNHRIRTVDPGTGAVRTWLGNGQPGRSLQPPQLSEPGGVSCADSRLYIADTNNHRICVADLATGEMTELTIAGLAPPNPAAARQMPTEPEPQSLTEQNLGVSDDLSVLVDLAVPEGYKLNEQTPIVWEVYTEGNQSLIASDVLASRSEATLLPAGDGSKSGSSMATFRIPLTQTTGQATLMIFVSYGYCADNSSLCRLAAAGWRVPVNIQPVQNAQSLRLEFPEIVAGSPQPLRKGFFE